MLISSYLHELDQEKDDNSDQSSISKVARTTITSQIGVIAIPDSSCAIVEIYVPYVDGNKTHPAIQCAYKATRQMGKSVYNKRQIEINRLLCRGLLT